MLTGLSPKGRTLDYFLRKNKMSKQKAVKVGTDADIMELSNEELIEKVYEVKDLNSTSVDDFGEFVNILGYQGDSMTAINDFLQDNPGAIESILEWLSNNISQEHRDNLEGQVPLDESPDDKVERIPCLGCGIPINMPTSDDPNLLLCDTCLEQWESADIDATVRTNLTSPIGWASESPMLDGM